MELQSQRRAQRWARKSREWMRFPERESERESEDRIPGPTSEGVDRRGEATEENRQMVAEMGAEDVGFGNRDRKKRGFLDTCKIDVISTLIISHAWNL